MSEDKSPRLQGRSGKMTRGLHRMKRSWAVSLLHSAANYNTDRTPEGRNFTRERSGTKSRAPRSHGTSTAEANDFTSDRRERLHKARWNVDFGEDVKKSLRLLSEVRLSPREVKPCGFVFFAPGKKMAVRFQNRHPQSETRFQPQKTQNFRVKSSLKTASLGRSLSWDARRIFFSGSKSRPIEQRICLL